MNLIVNAIAWAFVAWIPLTIALAVTDSQYVWGGWLLVSLLLICSLVTGIITMLKENPFLTMEW